MDSLTLFTSLALAGGAFALILYPLWRQTRPAAALRPDRPGQSLEEYEARYQAALAAIKDLMFDYEMGKVSPEDYETLLRKDKLEAAQIRRQIDLLSHQEFEIDPATDTKIESLVAKLKSGTLNGDDALPQNVVAEIEALKNIQLDAETGVPTCPTCGNPVQAGDAFCSGCGQSLAGLKPNEDICPNCGSPTQPDDTFCVNCGTRLNSNLTTQNIKNSHQTVDKQ